MSRKGFNIVAVDLETTMRCKREGHSSATPFDKNNETLCAGIYAGALQHSFYGDILDNYITFFRNIRKQSDVILVGHNFKFDLHYIVKDYARFLAHDDSETFKEFAKDWLSVPIWDTSIAHYLLTQQRDHFPSLADTATHWLGTESEGKSDFLKDLIESGKTTEDCYLEDLVRYMGIDCKITRDIALKQMEDARTKGMLSVIYTQCAAMKAVFQMEYYGIKFDLAQSYKTSVDIAAEQAMIETEICTAMVSPRTKYHEIICNNIKDLITSNKFWSCFFFGGTYTIKTKQPDGVWKSGKRKGETRFKSVEENLEFSKAVSPAEVGSTKGKSGSFAVDSRVLTNIEATCKIPTHVAYSAIAKKLLEYRELDKILNTYITSLPNKIWYDSIHPNINQTVTNTGRYSQSNPNLQNQSGDARVKELFIPRNGYAFVEADYKQLEVIAFAYVYRDPVLLDHIKNGIDIHERICLQLYGPSYSKEQRRIVKGVNFGTIYGGGSETIARQSGLDQKVVWWIQRAFFSTYTTVKPTRKDNISRLSRTDPFDYTVMDSPTGREYAIPLDRKVVGAGVEYVPHYTKMCNYPIQGLATGDIVPMMLAYVEKWIRDNDLTDDIRMLNTIHDSILFEVKEDKVVQYAYMIKENLEKAPEVFESVFKKEFDLPLKVDVQYSTKTWNGPWK